MTTDLMTTNTGALKKKAFKLPFWTLTDRQICDVELLLNGAFTPLKGFLGEADYDFVCKEMRLANGSLWPIPITLDVNDTFVGGLKKGDKIAHRFNIRALESRSASRRIRGTAFSPGFQFCLNTFAECK